MIKHFRFLKRKEIKILKDKKIIRRAKTMTITAEENQKVCLLINEGIVYHYYRRFVTRGCFGT